MFWQCGIFCFSFFYYLFENRTYFIISLRVKLGCNLSMLWYGNPMPWVSKSRIFPYSVRSFVENWRSGRISVKRVNKLWLKKIIYLIISHFLIKITTLFKFVILLVPKISGHFVQRYSWTTTKRLTEKNTTIRKLEMIQ